MKYFIAIFTFALFSFTSYSQNTFQNDDCIDAISIDYGQLIKDTFKLVGIDSTNCDPGFTSYDRGVWYKIVGLGNAGRMSFDSPDGNLYFRIFEGNCSDLICLNQFSEAIRFEEGKEYFVFISQHLASFSKSTFTFKIDLLPFESYQFCETTMAMACLDTLNVDLDNTIPTQGEFCIANFNKPLWIKIEGDGSLKKIKWTNGFTSANLKLFTGSCDNVECYNVNQVKNQYVFPTIVGQNYIFLISPYDQFSNTVSITLDCEEYEINGSCEKAKLLSCENSYSGTIDENSPFSKIEQTQAFFSSLNIRGLWYKFDSDTSVAYKIDFDLKGERAYYILRKPKNVLSCDTFEILWDEKHTSDKINRIIVDDKFDYYMVVFNNSEMPLDFNFSIQCENLNQLNYNCNNAVDLECNTALNFVGSNKDQYFTYYGYNNVRFQLWYSIENTQKALKISNNSTFGYDQLHIGIFENSCDSLIPVKYLSETLNSDRPIIIDFDPDKSYKIALGRVRNGGDFDYDIRLECIDVISDYTKCDGAIPLECNEEINITALPYIHINTYYGHFQQNETNGFLYWLTFTGDGSIKNIPNDQQRYFQVYTGSCDSLTLLDHNLANSSNKPLYIRTEPGIQYFVMVVHPYNYSPFNTSIKSHCTEEAENDRCENAIPIHCSMSSVTVSTNGASQEPYTDCLQSDAPILWYRFEGNDSLLVLNGRGYCNFRIFEDDCENLVCLSSFEPELVFNTEIGKSYLIALAIGQFQDPTTTFTIDCREKVLNTICTAGRPLDCNESIRIEFIASPVLYRENNNSYSEYWFDITGNGNIYQFNFENDNSQYSPLNYEIFDDCDSLIFSSIYRDTLHYSRVINGFNFKSEVDKLYKLKLIGLRERKFDLVVSCVEANDNITCNDAIQIGCMDTFIYKDNGRLYFFNEFNSYKDVAWYKLPSGKNVYGLLYDFDYDQRVHVAYLKSNDCGKFELVNLYKNEQNRAYLITSEDSENYLLVYADYASSPFPDKKYKFILECLVPPASVRCNDASEVICGQTYSLNLIHDEFNTFGNCSFPEAGNWFNFTGDGKTWSFNFDLKINEYALAYIGSGSCDDLECEMGSQLSSGNSFFNFETKQGIEYFVKVSGLGYISQGIMTVSCFEESENTNCDVATNIICGNFYNGIVDAGVTDSSLVCNNAELRPALYYQYTGDGDLLELNFLNIVTGQTAYVEIFEGSCESYRCLYNNLVTSQRPYILFDTKTNDSYIIKVSSTGSNNIQFKASCYEIHENYNCAGADKLECGEIFECVMKTPLNYNTQTPCFWQSNAITNWFQLPKTNNILKIEKFDTKDQFYFGTVVSGNCNGYQCIYSFDSNNPEFTIYNLDPNLDYYLIIGGNYYLERENISLKLSCIEPVTNDDCANATEISCGNEYTAEVNIANGSNAFNCISNSLPDVWYTFTGDGNVWKFRNKPFIESSVNFTMMGGQCGDFTCINTLIWQYNSNEYKLLTEPGKKYLIRISGINQPHFPIDFEVSCIEAKINDVCGGALSIDDMDTLNFDLSDFTDDNLLQNCGSVNQNGAWYKFEGNDSIINILAGPANSFNYVLLSGNCGNLICQGTGNIYYNEIFSFNASKGKTYFLMLYGSNTDDTKGSLPIFWSKAAENDFCFAAKEVECSNVMFFRNEEISIDPNPYCNDTRLKNVWYVYEGEASYVSIKNLLPNKNQILRISDGCETYCLRTFDYYASQQRDSFSFAPISGKKYYFNFNVQNYNLADSNKFVLNCHSKYKNRQQESAELLACGEYKIDFKDAPPMLENQCNATTYNSLLWYYFIGNDSIMRITGNSSDVRVEVMDENCNYLHIFNFGDNSFQTEKDRKYYLRVNNYYSYAAPINYTFNVEYNCITHTSDEEEGEVSLYPNPFKEKLVIDCSKNISTFEEIEITDMDGKKLFQQKFTNLKAELDLKNLVPGVYFLRMLNDDQSVVRKIIKME